MSAESNKEYSVNWKNHMSHVRKAFDHLLNTNELTDVTLYCDGKKIGAHKMLLSACSTYFRDVFKEVPCQHHVIIMQGVEYGVLSDILHFIYNGEVSVDTSKLDAFLKSAQMLQISGLTDGPSDKDEAPAEEPSNKEEETFVAPLAPAVSINDTARKVAKRGKTDETSAQNNKRQREEDESIFVSDVKCEPSELVNFEDPLEDPLVQNEQQGELFRNPGTQNVAEEDYKLATRFRPSASVIRERRLDGKLHLISTLPEGKRKDCVVCSNRSIPGLRRVTPYVCETCLHHPSLHPGDCFNIYHTQVQYKLKQKLVNIINERGGKNTKTQLVVYLKKGN